MREHRTVFLNHSSIYIYIRIEEYRLLSVFAATAVARPVPPSVPRGAPPVRMKDYTRYIYIYVHTSTPAEPRCMRAAYT